MTKGNRYYGLAPGKRVRLKYAYIVKHVSTERDPATGHASVIHVVFEEDKSAKVKGTLSWLSKVLEKNFAERKVAYVNLNRMRLLLANSACSNNFSNLLLRD